MTECGRHCSKHQRFSGAATATTATSADAFEECCTASHRLLSAATVLGELSLQASASCASCLRSLLRAEADTHHCLRVPNREVATAKWRNSLSSQVEKGGSRQVVFRGEDVQGFVSRSETGPGAWCHPMSSSAITILQAYSGP